MNYGFWADLIGVVHTLFLLFVVVGQVHLQQADALEADRCTYGCLHVTTPKCRTDDLRYALGEEIMDAPCALKSSIATV